MRLTPVVLLATFCACVQCAPVPITATKLDQAPTLDGKLLEACWQDPAPIRELVALGKAPTADSKTEAWVAHDAGNLYVAIKAYEPDMGKLKATVRDRDGNVLADDSISICLDPALDRFHVMEFAANVLGTKLDRRGDAAGISAQWNGVWSVATARAADHWSMEVAIPFATLDVSADVGDTWGLNVGRVRGSNQERSSWAQTGTVFADPRAFGEMTLKADLKPYMVNVMVADWGDAVEGTNTVKCRVINGSDAARAISLQLKVDPPDERPRVITSDLGALAPGSTTQAAITYQAFESGVHKLTLAAVDGSLPAERRTVSSTEALLDVGAGAQFAIFKSFYRDHATITYRAHVADADLESCHVRVTLRASASDAALRSAQTEALSARQGALRLQTAGIPRGQYEVHASLIGADGETLSSDVLQFVQARDDGVEQRPVSVRDDNMLIAQGKPFFPIGIYEAPGSEAALGRLSEAGFNVCRAAGSPVAVKLALDKSQQYGLRMWLPIGSTLDLSKDADARRERLEEYVKQIGDHPGLLCWESIDEPAWGAQSAKGLYEGYCYLRSLDQQRPIWTNHAPRNLISTLAYYNRATDIAGCDIYPVPEPSTHSNLPNKTISVTGSETLKSIATVNGEKPVFMVLQGFGWGELSSSPESVAKAVMPTFEQSRFMAYDAIVNGANGILYWGTHYTRKPSRFFSELKSVVSELSCLQEVLAARSYAGAASACIEPPIPGVLTLHKSLGGRNFVFVVNETPEQVQAKLTVPSTSAPRLRRLFEDQTLPVAEGFQVTVPLEAYGVAVLTDDPQFADVRKDFSAEYKNAPPVEAFADLLNVPGNTVRNPGFEVDRDGNGIPDLWSANFPFTIATTTEHVHSGKAALAVTGLDADHTPLAVMRRLVLKADAKHEMTAWVKTNTPGVEYRIYVEWSLGNRWYGKIAPWTKGSGQWEQITVPFTATPDPKGGAYCVVQLRGEGTVYFDDVCVRGVD